VPSASIVVVVIAQSALSVCEPGACGSTAMAAALDQAARRVLGADARIHTEVVGVDPSDEESIAMGEGRDGVVELSFASDGSTARIHCYLSREQRWLDREIGFGASRGSSRSETTERGRLLGFAVASLFSEGAAQPAAEPVPSPAAHGQPASGPLPAPRSARPDPASTDTAGATGDLRSIRRSIEFAGIAGTGLNGTAAGLGASAGLRLAFAGPLWSRLFVEGRTGSIPEAQATTRTVLMGGGVAVALLPAASRFELGARLDVFASYFDAAHLSEDDIEPDRRSRWQLGADLVAEAGTRISGATRAIVGLGLEGVLGKTEIYTHGNRVAVVAPVRAVAEVGFRTAF
jgi:hypothetical protein